MNPLPDPDQHLDDFFACARPPFDFDPDWREVIAVISFEENESYWRAGVLRHLLDPLQQALYDWWWALPPDEREAVLLIARRVGKTFLCVCIAIEIALTQPSSQQYFVGPDANHMRGIIAPIFDMIFAGAPDEDGMPQPNLAAPPDLVPKWKDRESTYVFQNGSKIILTGGGDLKKVRSKRGTFADAVWLDEAGYNDIVRYAVKSVFLPACKGRAPGRVTSLSNAPHSPAHEFMDLVDEAKERGTLRHATIKDSPRYTPEEVAKYAEESGGEESSDFQREYMANVNRVDDEMAIIPEWHSRATGPWIHVADDIKAQPPSPSTPEGLINEPLIREVPRPHYFDIYTTIDDGYNDLVSILTFYFDFDEQRVVVEGEAELYQATTDQIADKIHEVEQETWGEHWEWLEANHGWEGKPYRRIIDANPKTVSDLNKTYGYDFLRANKSDLHGQIKRLRKQFRYGEIVVHPRCTKLALHLKTGIWNTNKTTFARPNKKPRPGKTYVGHFDHISSLQHGTRMINRGHDPYPNVPLGISPRTHIIKHTRHTEVTVNTFELNDSMKSFFDSFKMGARRRRRRRH